MTPSRTVLVAASLALSALTGCSTHTMTIKYQPSAGVAEPARPTIVALGSVTDSRNTDANWLGTVQNSFGASTGKIYSDVQTADAVARVVLGALETRGMLGDAASADYRMDVNVARFESSQKANKKTQAEIAIAVNEIGSGEMIFQRNYRTTYESGHSSTDRADTPQALGEFANLALSDSIDQLLDDPDLRNVLQTRSAQLHEKRQSGDIVAARLVE